MTQAFSLLCVQVHELLRELPRRLREQALIDMYEPVLSMGQLFPHLDNRIIGAVLFYLEPQTYSPGEVVIKKGTPGSAMHVVCSGTTLLPSSLLPVRSVHVDIGMTMPGMRDGMWHDETPTPVRLPIH